MVLKELVNQFPSFGEIGCCQGVEEKHKREKNSRLSHFIERVFGEGDEILFSCE